MGIDIRWEDERGSQLDGILDPKACFGSALVLSSLDETVCLRFIDYYGNTIFNQRQIPVLISELHALLQLITPERVAILNRKRMKRYQKFNVLPRTRTAVEISEHVDRILELANRSKDKTHTYLKFIGD